MTTITIKLGPKTLRAIGQLRHRLGSILECETITDQDIINMLITSGIADRAQLPDYRDLKIEIPAIIYH